MKKIILLIVVLAVALLPLIGNKVIKATLDEKVKILTSNGVEVKASTQDASYLRTSMHYEFVVSDSQKYITYMNQYADQQIPSYVNMMLEGMHIGMDLSYSNILFNDSLEIDIYPLTLANKASLDLQKNDKEFYEYISNFLKIKGLLYHLNYDLSSESFDGYIKDIDEEYTFKDATDTKLIMKNMVFSGKGSLFHPSQIDSSLQKITMSSIGKKETLDLELENITSSATFRTKTTYSTKANVENMKMKTKGLESSEVYLKDLNFVLSADTQSKKAKFNGASSFKELTFKTASSNISLFDFNYDVGLTDIDKDAFEELRDLLSKAKTDLSPELQNKISNAMFNIISKGFILNIKDISVDKISKDSLSASDAFSIKALLSIKPDTNAVKNINTRPAEFLKNITLDALMKISKDFFRMMNKEVPVSMLAGGFAKEVGNDYVFDVKFKDSKLNVNGKAIK